MFRDCPLISSPRQAPGHVWCRCIWSMKWSITSIEPIIPEKLGGGGGGFRANLPCTVAYFNTKMLEQSVKPATLLCRSKLPPYQPFFFSGNIITLFKGWIRHSFIWVFWERMTAKALIFSNLTRQSSDGNTQELRKTKQVLEEKEKELKRLKER